MTDHSPGPDRRKVGIIFESLYEEFGEDHVGIVRRDLTIKNGGGGMIK